MWINMGTSALFYIQYNSIFFTGMKENLILFISVFRNTILKAVKNKDLKMFK